MSKKKKEQYCNKLLFDLGEGTISSLTFIWESQGNSALSKCYTLYCTLVQDVATTNER